MTRARARFSTQLDPDLRDRARAAVRGVAHATGTDYTLAQLVEDAIARELDRLESTYNDDQPWTDRRPLRRGRRVGQPPADH